MIKNKVILRFGLFLVLIYSFFGSQTIYGMKEVSSTTTDVQKFFKPELQNLAVRLDTNLKALLELFCCDPSEEGYKKLCMEIKDDLNKLVDYMQEEKFDWYPNLLHALCDEIKKQLVFPSNVSQFKCQVQIMTVWRMKNYLFELFDQKRMKNYLDCFTSYTEIVDNRSIDEIIKEYNEYKAKFSGINRIDQFFKKIDTAIEAFKTSKKSLEDEMEKVKKDGDIGSITGSLEWNFYNHILIPIMNYGIFHISDIAQAQENKEILGRDMKHQITFFENEIAKLEKEFKNSLLQALAQLKKEIKSFKPLMDEYILPHKKFLNLMIELAGKNCKRIYFYDSFDKCNPKKMVNNFIGNNLIKLEKPLKNAQKFLDESKRPLTSLVNDMVNGLKDLNDLDNLHNFLWAPVFNLAISIFERLIESESFANAVCTAGEKLLGDDDIKRSISEVRQAKKILNSLNLSLGEAKELIKLIGNDRLGILIKTVLRMIANNPKKTKTVLGEKLCKLVNTVQEMLNSLEKTNKEYSAIYFWRAKTKVDDIALLSYLSQVNKNIMKTNINQANIVTDLIQNESRENLVKKYAKIIGDLRVIAKQFEYCNYTKKELLESLKRDEKRLMIRIIEENDWNKKQTLEQELANIRKRLHMPVSNVFIKKTEERYNQLIALQKKE